MKNKIVTTIVLLLLSLPIFSGCNTLSLSTPSAETPVETSAETPVVEKKPAPITSIEYRTTEIPYNVIRKEEIRMAQGEEEIVQKGQPGYKREAYYVVRQDGKKISEEFGYEEIIEPVDEIVEYGTRVDKGMKNQPTDKKTYVHDEKTAESLFAAINKTRENHGLNPLIWDKDLKETAKKEAIRIFVDMDFRHNGVVPGENLSVYVAYNYESNIANKVLEGYMDSPSHRMNILDPNYKYGATHFVMGEQYFPTYYGWQNVLYGVVHFYEVPFAETFEQ